MVDITFLEVHVQDASFTKGDGREAEDVAVAAADETVQPESGGGSKGAAVAALVGLVFLAVVAYLVKTRVLSDAEDETFEFDDYD